MTDDLIKQLRQAVISPFDLNPVADRIEELTKQRDELLAALELLVAGIENSVSPSFIPLTKAQDAIASAKGGAA